MKILLLDIETAPHIAAIWRLNQEYVSPDHIIEPGYTLCYAARWLGSRKIIFDSVKKSGAAKMIRGIHRLLNEADAVCHYNGERFDIPMLTAEFQVRHMLPPAPFKQIDLLKTARKNGLPSKKMDYLAKRFGRSRKVKHKGMELWWGCMKGDRSSWATMERYNKQDVQMLEELHDDLLPWIKNYPNRSAYSGEACCTSCGSKRLQRRGFAITLGRRYARLQCQDCGRWVRENKALGAAPIFKEAV